MKKLFLLMAMVGLAFASCTPSDNNEGQGATGDNEVLGAGEFSIAVTDIKASSAHIKVAAKEATRTFYVGLTTADKFNENATVDVMNERYELLVSYNAEGNPWLGENGLLDTGVAEWTTNNVAPSTDYVVYAFGIDAQGHLTSADLTYAKFSTPASTFNQASWVGFWEVTSPKTYVQQTNILTEKYEEAWIDEELVRAIEIVDAAEMGLEGYAVIYGWDGFFLMDGPAIGVYNDNKIELLNNEIVYEEDGMVYQWLAQSELPTYDPENMYMVGGEYSPYTFVMDDKGNVSIHAYKGQITTGDVFIVSAFTIFPVVGEDIYVWNYDEPAYTFSGETMTAAKVEVAPAKLSAKNVKVMHKMANQKFVAKTFTAARFVK